MTDQAFPPTVDEAEWRAALDALRTKEKALTRELDALAAERRRLPMVRVASDYTFAGEAGACNLLDLFGTCRQLIVYHFMFGPDWEEGCSGCSYLTDAMTHPAHLRARDTALVLVSRAPLDHLLKYRDRMGWDIP